MAIGCVSDLRKTGRITRKTIRERLMKMKNWMKYTLCAAGGALAAGLIFAAGYLLWEKEPEQLSAQPQATEEIINQISRESEAFDNDRQDGIYTLLLVGNDDGNGNTDTMIICRFDTVNNSVDLVNIPRDTLVNLDWQVRKLNAVYWNAVSGGEKGIEALSEQMKRLCGFETDCYAVVDIDVFEEAVDLMGGVWFDVPVDMDYEDPSQNLSIHISKGYQKLDGEQAMGVVRFRDSYYDGDLGRIQVQQQFLSAAAKQLLSLGNIPNLTKLARLLEENTDTNLSSANIAWFVRRFMQCDSENIRFHTAPNIPEEVNGLSYTFLDLEPWLELVNSSLSPYKTPVTAENVDIVYLSCGDICCTRKLQGPWYYVSAAEKNSAIFANAIG